MPRSRAPVLRGPGSPPASFGKATAAGTDRRSARVVTALHSDSRFHELDGVPRCAFDTSATAELIVCQTSRPIARARRGWYARGRRARLHPGADVGRHLQGSASTGVAAEAKLLQPARASARTHRARGRQRRRPEVRRSGVRSSRNAQGEDGLPTDTRHVGFVKQSGYRPRVGHPPSRMHAARTTASASTS